MKLSASINFFNGEELLWQAVSNIRPLVEHLSIVYQENSKWGERITAQALDVIDRLKKSGMVDDFHCYEPDMALSASENEFQKRKIGLELATKSGASHFLIMDADEFYEPEQFQAAKAKIERDNITYSCVRSYFHIHQSIYRSEKPDITNVCFIAKITSEIDFSLNANFPAKNVDPTRRLINTSGKFHFFDEDEISMLHMCFVRTDFKSKLQNTSSAKDQSFIKAAKKALESWRYPFLLQFPNKPPSRIRVVNDIFNLSDVSYKESGLAIMGTTKKSILIATSRLEYFSGSEINVLELAMAFVGLNYDVTISAVTFAEPLQAELTKLDVQMIEIDELPEGAHFDFVWVQHWPVYNQLILKTKVSTNCLVYSSLAAIEPLECPPLPLGRLDCLLVNSIENHNWVEQNIPEYIPLSSIFVNTAPEAFFQYELKHEPVERLLRKIAVVSNHRPKDIESAIEVLTEQHGVVVDVYGLHRKEELVTPELLSRYQAVITIGKTVQYALTMGIPVYCYDHFGGPGWLLPENFDEALKYNFSGRCSSQKDISQIVEELVGCFERANGHMPLIQSRAKSLFSLKANLVLLLEQMENKLLTKVELSVVSYQTLLRRQNIATLRAFKESMALLDMIHSTKSLNSLLEDSRLKENIIELKLDDERANSQLLQSALDVCRAENQNILKSKSWRVTKPLKMAADQARKFKRVLAIIAKVARRPILIYKFLALAKKDGVKSALHRTHQFIEHPESMVQNIKLNVDDCVILTTYHCLYVAELIKDNLAKLGKKSEIIFGRPAEGYKKSVHFVICPQMFKSLPELYVSFQMEQSVSSRWFDDAYFTKLEKSFAIFDYSVANIKYLLDNEFYYQKIYFMPLSFRKNACLELSDQYEYDILFYGDVNCERRQNALKTLQKKYQVRIINDLFGAALRDELKKARVVVNVHYYEGALLETTRLYECLSLNKLVVSEKSVDMQNHANLENIVDFVEIGDFEGMLKRVEHWLEDDAALFKKVSENRLALMVQPDWFEFYFMRFLLSVDVIDFEQFYKIAAHNITFTQEIVCLGLIESIDRQADFDKDNHYGIQKFPGLRHRLGWVGCGLSYKFIMKKAKEQELKQITVCEDDVEFLDGWDKRYLTIKEYLKRNPKSWDIFAGLIAVLNPVAHVTNITQLDSEDFIHMDKMVSMVFNVYHADFFETLLSWDESNHDSAVNTIDRFIESTKEVKVVTTTPYLVGHKEDLHSTLWNFQNTQYNVMIEESAEALSLKIEEYQHAKFKF